MSCDSQCSVPWVGMRCVIVVFPDHTHCFLVCDRTQLCRPTSGQNSRSVTNCNVTLDLKISVYGFRTVVYYKKPRLGGFFLSKNLNLLTYELNVI